MTSNIYNYVTLSIHLLIEQLLISKIIIFIYQMLRYYIFVTTPHQPLMGNLINCYYKKYASRWSATLEISLSTKLNLLCIIKHHILLTPPQPANRFTGSLVVYSARNRTSLCKQAGRLRITCHQLRPLTTRPGPIRTARVACTNLKPYF